jgi:hypothetical protein
MRTYTVEVTCRIPEYAHLIVKAETPEAAMAKALECSESGLPSKSSRAEDQDGDIQILKDPEYDYESNLGRDRVTGIWEGQEAYPNNAPTLPLPPTPEEGWKRRSRRCLGESTRASESEQRLSRSQGQQRRFVRLSPIGKRRADASPAHPATHRQSRAGYQTRRQPIHGRRLQCLGHT